MFIELNGMLQVYQNNHPERGHLELVAALKLHANFAVAGVSTNTRTNKVHQH